MKSARGGAELCGTEFRQDICKTIWPSRIGLTGRLRSEHTLRVNFPWLWSSGGSCERQFPSTSTMEHCSSAHRILDVILFIFNTVYFLWYVLNLLELWIREQRSCGVWSTEWATLLNNGRASPFYFWTPGMCTVFLFIAFILWVRYHYYPDYIKYIHFTLFRFWLFEAQNCTLYLSKCLYTPLLLGGWTSARFWAVDKPLNFVSLRKRLAGLPCGCVINGQTAAFEVSICSPRRREPCTPGARRKDSI